MLYALFFSHEHQKTYFYERLWPYSRKRMDGNTMQEKAFPRPLSRRRVVKGLVGLMLAPGLAACATGPAPTTPATKTTAIPTPALAPTDTLTETIPKRNAQAIIRILT